MTSLSIADSWHPKPFLLWWGRRLGELVPRPLARLALGPERWLVVDLSAEPACLIRMIGDREIERRRIDREESDAAIRRLATRWARSAHVRVRLAPGRALRRRVDLPLAAEENLEAVLGFEMDRLTPFGRDDVYLAHDVVTRDRDAERLTLDLRVAPRQVVDEARARLRGWGLDVDRVEVAGQSGDMAAIAIDLPRRRSALARGHTALNWLFALALVGLVAGWHYRDHVARMAHLEALEREQVELLPTADETLALQALIEGQEAIRDDLHARRRTTPLAVALLEEIAAKLPDHSWLVQASMDDVRIEVIGYSPAVAELVSAFTASPLFDSVTFESPVTRDANRGLDQFHLGLGIAHPGGGTEAGS